MKIRNKVKGIIIVGVVTLAIVTNMFGGFNVGKTTRTDICMIDPPTHSKVSSIDPPTH